jgi:DNA mismatch endonuclease, patch repair protein
MRANRRRDSAAELRVRSLLHRAGLRFRVDLPLKIDEARVIRPDVVFTRQRVAVFIDGCFWHGCPDHGGQPKQNSQYWGPKILRNKERDREQVARLEAAGWQVLRVWEHDADASVVPRVRRLVQPQ